MKEGIVIQIKRAYLPVSSGDGHRFLVDRLWPRGLSRSKLKLSGWIKEAAPSDRLRKWFNHDPDRWNDFKKKYRKELKGQGKVLEPLLKASKKGKVTLLFAAKDISHNNAKALQEYLRSL